MEPQDVGTGGRASRNHASLRQQQEEFRRRLMRPNPVLQPSEDYNDDPVDNGGAEDIEPFAPPPDGARPDFQWAFQSPQGIRALADANRVNHGDDDGEVGEGNEEEEDAQGEDPQFDAALAGLKEISNLASFTVSTYKPGCGVKELLDNDVNQFWQSDGPQPHRLNIHFIKRVEIRALRLYLDYELDESYTPTRIQISAGFGPNQTIQFTNMDLTMPKGWIDVPIAGAGGGADSNSLSCWFVRVNVLENHQNGKDTHIRGIKVYAIDDTADTAENNPVEDMVEAFDEYDDRMAELNIHDYDEEAMAKLAAQKKKRKAKRKFIPGDGGLAVPDFMREPEIR
ncbi:anaphase-promoting complex, subunit 10-domain-containing protein [Hypoxylon crocopeplum]|nr:anaphase-promoting complex, subunit 10-domain-containing protein [Hypoxylon crocopeplum]